MEKATFGAGCFWGVEHFFREVPGVIEAVCGYAGGKVDHPTYKQVCTDTTGHAEVVEVTFDPAKVSYATLVDLFFKMHDPTQLNRQGPDFGTQYRTVIFAHSPEQEAHRRGAQEGRGRRLGPLQAAHRHHHRADAKPFWRAEDYHQRYFEKHGGSCHVSFAELEAPMNCPRGLDGGSDRHGDGSDGNAVRWRQVSRGDRYSGATWATRSPVLAQHGMAATEQPLASQIAIDILKKGGSAVDAAIAANAALGLMQPVLNGIGGDLFAIVYDPKTKKLYGYNGSGHAAKGRDLAKMKAEVAAAYKKAGMPAKDHIPPLGSLPVTVPGTVDALVRAARQIRQAADGRRSGARHRLCPERLSGHANWSPCTGSSTWPRSRRTRR